MTNIVVWKPSDIKLTKFALNYWLIWDATNAPISPAFEVFSLHLTHSYCSGQHWSPPNLTCMKNAQINSCNSLFRWTLFTFRSIVGSLRIFSLSLSLSLSHIRGQGNNIAHALAIRAKCSFLLQVWIEDVSSNVLHYVVEDFPI